MITVLYSESQRYGMAGKALMEQAIAVAEMVDLDADVAVEWSRVAMMSMVKEINTDPKNSAALMKRKYDQPCQMLLTRSAMRLRALMEQDQED